MYKELKNQIITGILSSPIIYVPHFHYQLLDEVLIDIVSPTKNDRKILDLNEDSIVEYDLSEGVIDFKNKKSEKDLEVYSNLYTYFSDIVEYESHFDRERIFLFRNFSHALDDPKIQTLLKSFTMKYEKGDYDRLTTILKKKKKPIVDLPLGI